MPKCKNLRRLLNVLLMLAMLGLAFGGVAGAERLRINPVPPHVVPQWTPMPDLPEVSQAPNLPTDVFRHLGRYYLYWEGIWYQSKNSKGPWERLQQPPAVLLRINPSYFKTMAKTPAPTPGTAPVTPPTQPEEGLTTPEGKPAVPPSPAAPPPAAPAAPTPPAAGVKPQPPAVPEPPAAPPAPAPENPTPKAM